MPMSNESVRGNQTKNTSRTWTSDGHDGRLVSSDNDETASIRHLQERLITHHRMSGYRQQPRTPHSIVLISFVVLDSPVANDVKIVVSDMGEHTLPKRDAPRIQAKQWCRKSTSSPPRRHAKGPTSGNTIPIVPKVLPQA